MILDSVTVKDETKEEEKKEETPSKEEEERPREGRQRSRDFFIGTQESEDHS